MNTSKRFLCRQAVVTWLLKWCTYRSRYTANALVIPNSISIQTLWFHWCVCLVGLWVTVISLVCEDNKRKLFFLSSRCPEGRLEFSTTVLLWQQMAVDETFYLRRGDLVSTKLHDFASRLRQMLNTCNFHLFLPNTLQTFKLYSLFFVLRFNYF